ncbi:hypothetical protein EVG20_g2009 [Dentipellis fragilis]|uniref:Autophagy-related protein 16 domain-containing protein n=1 Tax=Dentipellis fragilis TaxID=205917 RepID=A0A4Y9Z889_9AGAM|nr:hypothetical protein EVG20_g2009 [Dentipellis fragilis]
MADTPLVRGCLPVEVTWGGRRLDMVFAKEGREDGQATPRQTLYILPAKPRGPPSRRHARSSAQTICRINYALSTMSADALRDDLARLNALLAADRRQAAADAAAERDRTARAAQDRHDRLVGQLNGLTSLIADQTNDINSCTEQIRREASLTEQRRAEQDANLNSLQAMFAQVREGQERSPRPC